LSCLKLEQCSCIGLARCACATCLSLHDGPRLFADQSKQPQGGSAATGATLAEAIDLEAEQIKAKAQRKAEKKAAAKKRKAGDRAAEQRAVELRAVEARAAELRAQSERWAAEKRATQQRAADQLAVHAERKAAAQRAREMKRETEDDQMRTDEQFAALAAEGNELPIVEEPAAPAAAPAAVAMAAVATAAVASAAVVPAVLARAASAPALIAPAADAPAVGVLAMGAPAAGAPAAEASAVVAPAAEAPATHAPAARLPDPDFAVFRLPRRAPVAGPPPPAADVPAPRTPPAAPAVVQREAADKGEGSSRGVKRERSSSIEWLSTTSNKKTAERARALAVVIKPVSKSVCLESSCRSSSFMPGAAVAGHSRTELARSTSSLRRPQVSSSASLVVLMSLSLRFPRASIISRAVSSFGLSRTYLRSVTLSPHASLLYK
jgi:hypothetical protein